jgi:hypothetical protein
MSQYNNLNEWWEDNEGNGTPPPGPVYTFDERMEPLTRSLALKQAALTSDDLDLERRTYLEKEIKRIQARLAQEVIREAKRLHPDNDSNLL